MIFGKTDKIDCLSLISAILFLFLFNSFAQASFIGKDDRRKISIDNRADSVLASRIAAVQFCGFQSTGILIKLKDKDEDYMLISGHHLFTGIGKFRRHDSNKDGVRDEKDKRCSLKEFLNAKIAFNIHYKATKFHRYAFTVEKQLIDGAPINFKDAKNYWSTGEDVLLVKLKRKISEQIMPDTREKRGALRFLEPGKYHEKHFNKKAFTIAFDGYHSRAIVKSNACAVKHFHIYTDPRINYKSKCDTAPGASNSPMLIDVNGEPTIWGIVVMGATKNLPDDAPFEKWTAVKTTKFIATEYGFAIATGEQKDQLYTSSK